jgi:hypothetical protein
MTLVMLFFNFFSQGYMINSEKTSKERILSPTIEEKVSNDNDNTELYKELYVQLVENLQRNNKRYLMSFRDIEALGYLLHTINASVGNLYPLQFSKEVPTFNK